MAGNHKSYRGLLFCLMAISKQKKQLTLAKLKAEVASSPSLVFVNFHGLLVSQATALRQALAVEGVSYLVVKKTLVKLALANSKATGEPPALEGEIALAYLPAGTDASADPIAPARGLRQFGEKLTSGLKIVGGIFDGRYLDSAAMMEIASIPSRLVLLSRLVAVLNSPLVALVATLDAAAKKQS